MTETAPATKPRFQGSFWFAVMLVFALQLAAVFIFNRPKPVPIIAQPQPLPQVTLGNSRPPEIAALEDPRLFVFATIHGFSGQIWMPMPQLEYRSRSWSEAEPIGWLTPDASNFFQSFTQYIQDNTEDGYQAPLPEPTVTFPFVSPRLDPAVPSSLRIEGHLSNRALLNPEPLPVVTDAATNSVIEVVVDPLGNVFSAAPATRTVPANDELAVRYAYGRRFEPIEVGGPNRTNGTAPTMMTGTLIFEWRPAPPETQPVP
jgi:hypothetical protein